MLIPVDTSACSAPLAQSVERRSHNPEVVSSILTGSIREAHCDERYFTVFLMKGYVG